MNHPLNETAMKTSTLLPFDLFTPLFRPADHRAPAPPTAEELRAHLAQRASLRYTRPNGSSFAANTVPAR